MTLIPLGILAAQGGPPSVEGGVLFSDATYFYRRFTGTGNLVVKNFNLVYDALLIGGGGGGGGAGAGQLVNGWRFGGGGGGGGIVLASNKTLGPGTYLVAVPGGGGNARIGSEPDIAYAGGGGGGAGFQSAGAGGDGASGGGGGYTQYNGTFIGAAGLAIYGAQGTNGVAGSSSSRRAGGLATTAYATEWTSKVGLGTGVQAQGGTNGQYYQAGSQGAGYGGGGGGSSEIDGGWGGSFRGGSGGAQGLVIIRYTRSQIPS